MLHLVRSLSLLLGELPTLYPSHQGMPSSPHVVPALVSRLSTDPNLTLLHLLLHLQASRKRKPLIAIQLALQGLVLVLLVVQLGLGSADSYEVVAGAPTFSLEWRFDDFAKDLWGVSRAFNAWDGTVHFNLNRVAFETNLTNNPKICRTRPEICLNSKPDGSLRRFSWPLGEFLEVVQREIDGYASSLLPPVDFPSGPHPFGSVPTDAPWYFDLAVNSEGHACSEINEYEYSYGSASGMFDCNRVWDVRPPTDFTHFTPSPSL